MKNLPIKKAVVILQNAWSPLYAGGEWPRPSWLKALRSSRSGQRLNVLEQAATGIDLWYDNTTPIVGDCADSVIKPDLSHISFLLYEQNPDCIIACGKQSAKVMEKFAYEMARPLLIVPHPAYRVLSNELYQKAGELLVKGFSGVVEFVQNRGYVFKCSRDYKVLSQEGVVA